MFILSEYEVGVMQEIMGLPDFEPVVLLPDEEMEVVDQQQEPTNYQGKFTYFL